MKANFIKTGLLIAFSAIIFSSCQKADLPDLAPAPAKQQISLKQIASSPQFAKVYQEMEAKFNANSSNFGAEFILPFFTSSGFGLGQNMVVVVDCTSYPPWCSVNVLSGQLAFFGTELGPNDFFRRNPDSTVTVHINSKKANIWHLDIAPNIELTGTNAHLNMTFTGPVRSFTYTDWNNELITVYYIDWFGNNRGAISFHGNGKVRQGNTGPFKNLVSRWVANPGWTQETAFFTLN